MGVRILYDTTEGAAALFCSTSNAALACPLFRDDDADMATGEMVAEAFLTWHRERRPLYDIRSYSPIDLASRVGQFHAWRDGQRVIANFDGRGLKPDARHLRPVPGHVEAVRDRIQNAKEDA